MKKENKLGNELFTIKATYERDSMFWGLVKLKQNMFVAYEKGLEVTGNVIVDVFPAEDIFGIYRDDNLFSDENHSTLKMDCMIYDKYMKWSFDEDSYPNIIEKMESLYDNEWKKYARNCSDTIKWFLAVIANWNIIYDRNYNVFGPIHDGENLVDEDIEILENDWGINSSEDLHEACSNLYNDNALMNKYKYFLDNVHNEEFPQELLKIESDLRASSSKCISAYNLYRLVLISNFGYTAKYFTYEEALDWCLKAGEKLQELFISWDDYYSNYMLGYCFWSEEDAYADGTNANMRRVVYEKTKRNSKNPWKIRWNTKLERTW